MSQIITPPHYIETRPDTSQSSNKGVRIFYLDALKAFSILAMILLHVSAVGLSEEKIATVHWNICGLYNSLCHFCVPVFVMISGALLLGNDKPTGKYIKRIAISLCFWCIAYSLYVQIGDALANSNFDAISIFKGIFDPTHLWFLWMILCLYIATPILRCITQNERVMKYFIALWVIFAIVLPALTALPEVGSIFKSVREQTHFTLTVDYCGYFMLGYYLANRSVKMFEKYAWLYVIGGFAVTFAGTYCVSNSLGNTSELFLSYHFPTTFIIAVGVFLIFKQWLSGINCPPLLRRIVYFISSCSLGIYAIHMFYLVAFHKIGFTYNIFTSILSIPLVWIVCLILSLFSVWIIKRFIPGGDRII